MNRRTFLKGAGAITVVAGGGGVWRAVDQGVFTPGEGRAYEPWREWRAEAGEGPLALVRAAILASNPHNTQPWLFRVTESRVDLHADATRGLGAFDPYLREMHIGLGCAVENMAVAARAGGYEPAVTLFEGDLAGAGRLGDAPVARIDLRPSPRLSHLDPPHPDASHPDPPHGDPLYDAIGHRHTNRSPYDPDRSLPSRVLDELRGCTQTEGTEEITLFLFTGDEKSALGARIVEATEAIIADPGMIRDSDRWFRHTRSEVERFRDGPTLDAAGLPPVTTALAKMLPRPSPDRNHQYWLDATRDVHVPTAPLLGLLAVRDLYDRPQSLRAGRAWQRMHLTGTVHGIAMQPLNQPVELVDRQRELGTAPRMARALEAFTGGPEWKPTFAFRAGYARREASASPRRALEDVVHGA